MDLEGAKHRKYEVAVGDDAVGAMVGTSSTSQNKLSLHSENVNLYSRVRSTNKNGALGYILYKLFFFVWICEAVSGVALNTMNCDKFKET